MDLELRNARVLVTGATAGIGAAVVQAFVAEGARVVAAGGKAGNPVPDGVEAAVYADLVAADAPGELVARAVDVLGGLDAVVAAAGQAFAGGVEETGDELWHQALGLNLLAPARLLRAALPHLRASRGRAVLLTAVSAREPRAHHTPSSSAKAAAVVLAKTLSREVAADGVLVNCVAPGRIRSRQADRFFPEDDDRERYAREHIPLGRFGLAAEVAPIVLFLASPANTYITGQSIAVDGGMSHAV